MKRVLICITLLLISVFAVAQIDVVIEGHITNAEKYREKVNFVKIIINEIAFGDQVTYVGQINTDGSFKIVFPKDQPQDIYFDYKGLKTLFVKPGDQLTLDFDAENSAASVKFSGSAAKVNEDIQAYDEAKNKFLAGIYGPGRVKRFEKLSAVQKESTEEVYKTFLYVRLKQEQAFLKEFMLQRTVSDDFKKWAKYELEYECANDLMRYVWLHSQGKEDKPSEKYYDFFDRFPLDNQDAAISSKYGDYVGEYANYLAGKFAADSSNRTPVSMRGIAAILLKKADLTNGQRKRLAKLSQKSSDKVSITLALTLKKLLDDEKNEDIISEELSFRIFRPMINYYASNSSGFLRDVLLSNKISELVEASYTTEISAEIDDYKNLVATAYLEEKIIDKFSKAQNKMLNYTLPAGANINLTPQAGPGSVFNKIMSQYPGKVVYVDFWATWCGPCIEEMPKSKLLREKLTGEDVVFVYLGVSSPEKTWKAVIAQLELKGENYLLNDNEYKQLSASFQISGIPHYVLVDKHGRIKDDNAKSPGDAGLEREIRGLLKDQ